MSSQDQQPDKFDQLLDAGLKDYSAAEPLAGLEERILARLESADEAPAPWWHRFTGQRLTWQDSSWALAVLLLAGGIGFGIWLTTRPGEDVDYVAENPEVIDVKGNNPIETTQAQLAAQIPFAKLPKFKAPFVFNISPMRAAVTLKQDVFPAAAPLTEQERLALTFVRMPPAPKPIAPEPGIAEIEVKPVDVTPLNVRALGPESKNAESKNAESRDTESQR
jgi:hypothetical protein